MHMGQGIASPIAYPPNYRTFLLYWNLNDLIQTDHHFIDTKNQDNMLGFANCYELLFFVF